MWAAVAGTSAGLGLINVASAVAFIIAGVVVVWVASARWTTRERWTVRVQATAIGASLVPVLLVQDDTAVATVAVVVAVFAFVFLHVTHIIVQALHRLQAGVVTIRGHLAVESARQSLYVATFVIPLTIALSPNLTGAVFVAATTFAAGRIARALARRRITQTTEAE